MPPKAHFNLEAVDFTRKVAGPEEMGEFNPQRFEWQQLDAIVLVDTTQHIVVGYKDVHADEYWVRGHLPGFPLMPGVLMCEASAQMCSYYALKYKLVEADFIGFGGMDNVRFRGPVRPGDRLVFVGKALKLHRKQMIFSVQGFVNGSMVFEGEVIGMSMTRKEG